ncbi:hypothetical protein RND81_05G215900 [Saponaria officinalis]|uniref:Uncharacterized protein n=1 Tax=Saponaria officinalis TaxID=3572 RepID=A0AAW1KZU4_SAPOF
MESYNNSKEGNSEKLVRLLEQLMTKEEGTHATFDHVDVHGSNVGAVMHVTPTSPKEVRECGVNIYISNNIQGVNNSILVGSDVKMGEPGLGLSFRDVKLKREIRKVKSWNVLPRFRLISLLLFAFAIVVSVVFAFYGVVSNEEMYRVGLSLFLGERNECIKFPT